MSRVLTCVLLLAIFVTVIENAEGFRYFRSGASRLSKVVNKVTDKVIKKSDAAWDKAKDIYNNPGDAWDSAKSSAVKAVGSYAHSYNLDDFSMIARPKKNHPDPCESGVCKNGAECTKEKEGDIDIFECVCAPGYIGTYCEVEIDECQSNPCENGAVCTDAVNAYSCTCKPGYQGPSCKINLDECHSQPCANRAMCVDVVNGYLCQCKEGYAGINCKTEKDECQSQPCVNEAQCVDEINGYTCQCKDGYTGSNCEQDKDECQSNPCENGALCTDAVNAYSCTCKLGYQGPNCEITVSVLSSEYTLFRDQNCFENDIERLGNITTAESCISACDNDEWCIAVVHWKDQHSCFKKFMCFRDDLQSYAGLDVYIRKDIDECQSNPCENGAVCTDAVNAYSCTCKPGYQGPSCEIDLDECHSQPCANGALCVDVAYGYVCQCKEGYAGINCQTEIDECQAQPCVNGAQCEDEINGYACQCKDGYTGSNCEQDIDECQSNPCENGAVCTDAVNAYTCTCKPGYKGPSCEIAVSVPNSKYTLFRDQNCYENDIEGFGNTTTAESCIRTCDNDVRCTAVVHWKDQHSCYKKSMCFRHNMQYNAGLDVYIRKDKGPRCPEGQVYNGCASKCNKLNCNDQLTDCVHEYVCDGRCECPPGQLLHEHKCIPESQCPDPFPAGYYRHSDATCLGNDIEKLKVSTALACAEKCQLVDGCKGFELAKTNVCYLKKSCEKLSNMTGSEVYINSTYNGYSITEQSECTGNDYVNASIKATKKECEEECNKTPKCVAYVWKEIKIGFFTIKLKQCYIKNKCVAEKNFLHGNLITYRKMGYLASDVEGFSRHSRKTCLNGTVTGEAIHTLSQCADWCRRADSCRYFEFKSRSTKESNCVLTTCPQMLTTFDKDSSVFSKTRVKDDIAHRCQNSQVYEHFCFSCNRTCDNPNPKCFSSCAMRCTCPNGTVLHKERCITQDKCPAKAVKVNTCPEGLVFNPQALMFPKTCNRTTGSMNAWFNFAKFKVPQCECKSGTVLHKGACIPETECPKYEKICPNGMVWNKTASAVTKTCNSTDGWFWGVTRRIPRCDCTHGTVLHEGKCIPQTECPGKVNTCPEGLVFNPQARMFPKTCNRTTGSMNTWFNFAKFKVPQCECKSGTVLHKGACIPETECPKYEEICPNGMVWNKTALAVKKTCNSTDGWFWGVTRKIPRCDCTHGTVLHEGKCIPQTQCPGKACPAGMVWNETALAVTKTCSSTGRWFWGVTRKIPRCDCTHGTVLHEGKCIPQTQCPGKECPAGMIWNYKASRIPKTCFYTGIFSFWHHTLPKCECKIGTVLHNTKCIPKSMCPPKAKTCPSGQEWNLKALAYPENCEVKKKDTFATQKRTAKCECKKGTILHKGKCIPRSQCPNKDCPSDQVWNEKASLIPATCDNMLGITLLGMQIFPMSTFGRRTARCDCQPGTVLHKDKCVPKAKCPSKAENTECTGGQNYTTCGSTCTKTCQNPNPVCMRGCVKKCQCPTGTVLQEGNCIDKADCLVKVEDNDTCIQCTNQTEISPCINKVKKSCCTLLMRSKPFSFYGYTMCKHNCEQTQLTCACEGYSLVGTMCQKSVVVDCGGCSDKVTQEQGACLHKEQPHKPYCCHGFNLKITSENQMVCEKQKLDSLFTNSKGSGWK